MTNMITGRDISDAYSLNKWPSSSIVAYKDIVENFTQTTPSFQSKEVRCRLPLSQNCDNSHPYQCLIGNFAGKCAAQKSVFQNSSGCDVFCNINNDPLPAKIKPTFSNITNNTHKSNIPSLKNNYEFWNAKFKPITSNN